LQVSNPTAKKNYAEVRLERCAASCRAPSTVNDSRSSAFRYCPFDYLVSQICPIQTVSPCPSTDRHVHAQSHRDKSARICVTYVFGSTNELLARMLTCLLLWNLQRTHQQLNTNSDSDHSKPHSTLTMNKQFGLVVTLSVWSLKLIYMGKRKPCCHKETAQCCS